ncbi:hypothetical protein CYMTET_26020 [Cymbomonas tetramitiformis]|uniref:EGF-like domain-containing protein n=1 Tax=Cymbomonas tetramitiformis TaxID=36881 RepID=A0AAE0FT95_9CHLO|nr:hypothetical protein CYMTET_26020 [Cymbomonas tetramitiformis]
MIATAWGPSRILGIRGVAIFVLLAIDCTLCQNIYRPRNLGRSNRGYQVQQPRTSKQAGPFQLPPRLGQDASRRTRGEEPAEQNTPQPREDVVTSSVQSSDVASGRKLCPEGCLRAGTCNFLTGTCECPVNATGSDCRTPALPSCMFGNALWLPDFLCDDHIHASATEVAKASSRGGATRGSRSFQGRYFWVGPIPCECVMEAISGTMQARYEGIHVVCLDVNSDTSFLESAVPSVVTDLATPSGVWGAVSVQLPPVLKPALPATLEFNVSRYASPLAACPDNCAHLGWCDARGECRCLKTLARLSPEGVCDVWGFCHCEDGFWGLDCGLRWLPGDSAPVVHVSKSANELTAQHTKPRRAQWAASPADAEPSDTQRPRIYVFDLNPALRSPCKWRFACHLLLERVLQSSFRVADPASADYFWIPSALPIHEQTLAALLHILRDGWASYMPGRGQARQILPVPFDHGGGDLRRSRAQRDAASDPWSPARELVFLQLHGARDGADQGNKRCRIGCAQSGKDIVVPPSNLEADGPLKGYSLEDLQKRSPW